MLCKSPFHKDGLAFGCGQCLPCKINKRREWTTRIMLESYTHPVNSFVTLTYNDLNLPLCMSVCSTHVRNWLKRLREKLPYKIRFYLSAEYGDDKNPRATRISNPHYHLALFNHPPCIYGRPPRRANAVHPDSRTSKKRINEKFELDQCLCPSCKPIAETWDKGLTYTAELSTDSAQYIASYVCKGLSKLDEISEPRLWGRAPEFSRMSNRPYGIGAKAMDNIADLYHYNQFALDDLLVQGDVTNVLNIGGKELPLGRYLKNKLRSTLLLPEGTPDHILADLEHEQLNERWELIRQHGAGTQKFYQHLRNEGKITALEKREQIFKQEAKL